MGFEDEVEQSLCGGLIVRLTIGPSGHANSPHPSSREGHLSTARWSSSFLLSGMILNGFHAAAVACSLVQRNSVPSTQMRCKGINVPVALGALAVRKEPLRHNEV
jgi:hypothetical protein